MQGMTSIDGHISLTEEARIPVLDRGFLYGDSVYEVFRTYDGVPLFFDEHWRRLQNSASLIYMDPGRTRSDLIEEIRRTVQATGAPDEGCDVYVRYTITRGQGPVDLVPDPRFPTRCIVLVKEVPSWNPDYYSKGVSVAIPRTRRNPVNALDPNIKGGNYLNNVLGIMEARRLGADDCIMLNHGGFITEASNSNVFFMIDGNLVTPSDEAGNLRGLTREAVLEACASHGMDAHEEKVPVDSIVAATECFLTSATREVMPVRTLRLEDGATLEFPAGGGELTRTVAGLYKDYVSEYVQAHRALSLFE
jgi:branched-chain amino acid aminotransferase